MSRAAQNPSPSQRRPIGIDLFAGAGGRSLGFEQAGFDVRAAVEIDPIHAAIHHFNFPECTVLPQSVRDLDAKKIRAAAGIGEAPVDVVMSPSVAATARAARGNAARRRSRKTGSRRDDTP